VNISGEEVNIVCAFNWGKVEGRRETSACIISGQKTGINSPHIYFGVFIQTAYRKFRHLILLHMFGLSQWRLVSLSFGRAEARIIMWLIEIWFLWKQKNPEVNYFPVRISGSELPNTVAFSAVQCLSPRTSNYLSWLGCLRPLTDNKIFFSEYPFCSLAHYATGI
jgi:hypothetical protein